MGTKKEVAINLKEMTTSDGKPIYPSHLYLIGIQNSSSTADYIEDVFLSMDGSTPTAIEEIEVDSKTDEPCEIYTINGMRDNELQPGINNIRKSDGKVRKVMNK